MERSPKEQGVVTESKVLNELLSRGVDVSQPFGDNSRYDFVVDDGELHRVQVKTAHSRDNGTVKFNTASRRPKRNGRNAVDGYDGDIDAFCVYCPDYNDIWWIDVEESTKDTMILRIEPTSNGQTKGINWAEDFELDNKFDFDRKI